MQQGPIQRIEGGRRTRGEALDKKPLISIITVVFRDKEELECILQNVFGFNAGDLELIVIDGGSDDGTVELLQYWDAKIDYWLSESDAGIYDAMNKGISAAHGEYILHLNAGDRLLHLPVQELKDALVEQMDVAAFRVFVDGRREFHPAGGWRLRIKNTLHHQGTFYRRETVPRYDERYRVLADFDLNQRLIQSCAKIKTFDKVVALSTTDGISNRPGVADSEHYRIIRNHNGWSYVAASWVQRKWDGLKLRTERILRRV